MATSTSGGRAVVDLYGEIGWYGVLAEEFVPELRRVAADADVVEFHINSPGGDVFEGLAIYTVMTQLDATIEVQIDGLAGSIASIIAQGGDKVSIGANAQIMIHDAMSGQFGNATELRQLADQLDMASDNIAAIYAERSGLGTIAEWRAAMQAPSANGGGTWYTADEALDAGLVDEVLSAGKRKGDEGDPRAVWQSSMTARLVAMTNQHISGPAEPVPAPAPASPAQSRPAPIVDRLEPEPEPEPEPAPEPEGPTVDADPWAAVLDALTDAGPLAGIGDQLAEAVADEPEWDPSTIAAAIHEAAHNAPAVSYVPLDPVPDEPTEDELWSVVAEAIQEGLFHANH